MEASRQLQLDEVALARAVAPGAWAAFRPIVWTAAVCVGALAFQRDPGTDWLLVLVLVAVGNAADLGAVRLRQGMRVSSAHFAAPIALLAISFAGAVVTAVACIALRYLHSRSDWRAFDAAVNVASVGAASAIWAVWPFTSSFGASAGSALAMTGFVAARACLNNLWAAETRRRGIDLPKVSARIGRLMLSCAVMAAPAVVLFDASRGMHGAWLLLGMPFVATQLLIGAFGRERGLNDQLQLSNDRLAMSNGELALANEALERANLQFAAAMVRTLEARDPYTAGHSIAVAAYTRDIARECGFDADTCASAHLAGLLHDIGKVGVVGSILNKREKLTDEEYEAMKAHAVIGADILAEVGLYADLSLVVRYHHERYDGTGYPDGLAGEHIPAISRMIAVADTYSAMTTDRPYRAGMDPQRAMEILAREAGSQLDPVFTPAFLRVLEAAGDDYRRGRLGRLDETARPAAPTDELAAARTARDAGPARRHAA